MMICKFIHEFSYQWYGIDSKIFQFLHRNRVFALPVVLLPLASLKAEDVEKFEIMLKESLDSGSQSSGSWWCLCWSWLPCWWTTTSSKPEEHEDCVVNNQHNNKSKEVTVFRADIRLVSIITDIAIFFTFGTIFPPLAVVGFVSICLHTLTMDVSLGRMIWLARYRYPALHCNHCSAINHELISKSTILESYLKIINKECHGASQLFSKSLLSLSYLLSIFWSLFLYDTLGDALGAKKAIWIIVLMGTFAGLLDLVNMLVRWRSKRASLNVMTPSANINVDEGLQLDMLEKTNYDVDNNEIVNPIRFID
jgi:hypothetical protein